MNLSINITSLDTKFQKIIDQQPSGKHRIKERYIEDAIVLVLKWRKLTEGGNQKKVTLKQGADMIGIAKKSLDDYLLQLRLGKSYGFDFFSNRHEKVGVLRSFNRRMKRKLNQGKFMPGRKKKDDELNHIEFLQNLIDEINCEQKVEKTSDLVSIGDLHQDNGQAFQPAKPVTF